MTTDYFMDSIDTAAAATITTTTIPCFSYAISLTEAFDREQRNTIKRRRRRLFWYGSGLTMLFVILASYYSNRRKRNVSQNESSKNVSTSSSPHTMEISSYPQVSPRTPHLQNSFRQWLSRWSSSLSYHPPTPPKDHESESINNSSLEPYSKISPKSMYISALDYPSQVIDIDLNPQNITDADLERELFLKH